MTTDGTLTKADAILGTKEAETPKYTEADLIKARTDAQTAVKADIRRMQVESEKALKAAQAASERLIKLQKEQEDRELEAAKDEPDKLTVIREKQARRQKEAELAEAQEKLNEANTKLQELTNKDAETKREHSTREVAERLKVDPARLAKLAKYTDGSAEAIEEIARELPKINAGNPQRNTFSPDNNEADGGTGKTKDQIRKDFTSGKISNEQYEKEMKSHGYQP